MILAMALMLEDWLPAFSGAQTDVPSFRDGWLVQTVVEAARTSSAGAGWVDIPDRDRGTSRTDGAVYQAAINRPFGIK
jgi:hypothetical protein